MENLSDVSSNTSISPEEMMSTFLQHNNSYITATSEYAANFTLVSIGLLGNGLVLYVIGRSSKMRKQTTTLFLRNQSCIDFVAVILMLIWFLSKQYQYDSGVVSNIVCRFVSSPAALVLGVVPSTLNLVAITGERYLMVCHPVLHNNWYSHKKALTVAISVWLIGCLFSIPHILTTRVVNNECLRAGFWFHPALEKAYWITIVVTIAIGPGILFIIAYAKIYLTIHRRNKMKRNNTLHLQDPNNKYKLGATEKNILKTMLIVSTCYFVCYLPMAVKFTLVSFGMIEEFIGGGSIYELPRLFVFSNACVNPFIYAFKFEIFQKECKRYICLRCDNIRVHPSIATVTNDLP